MKHQKGKHSIGAIAVNAAMRSVGNGVGQVAATALQKQLTKDPNSSMGQFIDKNPYVLDLGFVAIGIAGEMFMKKKESPLVALFQGMQAQGGQAISHFVSPMLQGLLDELSGQSSVNAAAEQMTVNASALEMTV